MNHEMFMHRVEKYKRLTIYGVVRYLSLVHSIDAVELEKHQFRKRQVVYYLLSSDVIKKIITFILCCEVTTVCSG